LQLQITIANVETNFILSARKEIDREIGERYNYKNFNFIILNISALH